MLLALVMWLFAGFPSATPPTTSDYYVEMTMVLLTIITIPPLLKYITHERVPERYTTYCALRMAFLLLLTTVDILLYYLFSPQTAYFYLALMTWVAMLFCFPKERVDD